MRRVASIALAGALGLGTCVALTSCFPSPEQIVESAIREAGGGDVDLNSGGSLPAGFPADVPVIEGEILNGFAAGGAFNLNVRSKGTPAEAFVKAVSLLTDAGFTSETSTPTAGTLASDTHRVALLATAEGGNAIVNYLVTALRG